MIPFTYKFPFLNKHHKLPQVFLLHHFSGASLPTSDTNGQLTSLITSLQFAYSGTDVVSNTNISSLLATNGTSAVQNLGTAIISNQLGGKMTTAVASGGGGGGGWGSNADPYFNSVSLLLHMDGVSGSTTFTDSSSNSLNVVAVGNTQISTLQSKWGLASGYFDNGHLSLPDSEKLQLRTDQWTIEFWVYSSGGFTPWVWNGGGINQVFISGPARQGALYWPATFNVSGDAPLSSSSISVPGGQWTHIALVSQSATVGKLYVGGQLGATVGGNKDRPQVHRRPRLAHWYPIPWIHGRFPRNQGGCALYQRLHATYGPVS